MMLYVAPTELSAVSDDPRIFIAGGITGCEDWQSEIVECIDVERFNVFNPRRPGGIDKTGGEAIEQITWEHEALSRSDVILFWFPSTSICPITLFEYGGCLERASRYDVAIVLGRDPHYERAFDLDVQTRLVTERHVGADIVVHNDKQSFKDYVSRTYGANRQKG